MFNCTDVVQAFGLTRKKHVGSEDLYLCPVHKDTHPSLTINPQKDVFMCGPCNEAGTAWQLFAFLERLDPDSRNVFDAAKAKGLIAPKEDTAIMAMYDYTDINGNLLYQIIRRYPKQFSQRHMENGEWINSMNGIPRVPFRLHKLAKAEDIFIVEGEKDVLTLERMGLTATCNSGGAGKWLDHFAEYFNKKQHVTIIPDNDEPGLEHAAAVKRCLSPVVADCKILRLPGLQPKQDVSDWAKGRDPIKAAEDLIRLIDDKDRIVTQPELMVPEIPVPVLWDMGTVATWPTEPLVWLVENLIPLGGIGFLSGAPKDGKSLLTADLLVHMAHGKPWMQAFDTMPINTLCIAREDPIRRIKERITEINDSYGYPAISTGSVQFLIRDRFDLMDKTWTDWLVDTVKQYKIKFLILDVLNRMIPDLDELSAKDMAKMVSQIEFLNRVHNLTILCLDHTRKPQGPGATRAGREPNPFDLKGSVAKYGAADFMLCLSRTNEDGRLQLYCENKDTDQHPHFLIGVSPKDSKRPKFTYISPIVDLANQAKATGDNNRQAVADAMDYEFYMSMSEINAKCPAITDSTIRRHLNSLLEMHAAEFIGNGKYRKWRRIPIAHESDSRVSDRNLFDDGSDDV